MNLADTSLAAFKSLDITAGQARILSAFRPGLAITRQELVTLTGLPINSVSGRCTELLEAGVLESLPTVEGRHPLRLKNAAQQMREPARVAASSVKSPRERFTSVGAAPINAPRSTHCDGNLAVLPTQEIASHEARPKLVAVVPALFGRNSLSVADAKRIYPSDKANAFWEEAKRVVEGGVYRIWS